MTATQDEPTTVDGRPLSIVGCGRHDVFVTDDNIIPTCDHCNGPQYTEGDDWNGETGCHFSCERAAERERENPERLALYERMAATEQPCWLDDNGWGDVSYGSPKEEADECRLMRGGDACLRHADREAGGPE